VLLRLTDQKEELPFISSCCGKQRLGKSVVFWPYNRLMSSIIRQVSIVDIWTWSRQRDLDKLVDQDIQNTDL